jgi:peptidoglycan hydrolase CwlO-like protein
MIESLNDDIERLHTAIDEYANDIRNLHNRLRKQARITNSYKEMTQILMELIGEIEK